MFHRDYMEYHADRYVEHSQLVFNKKKLIAILPANLTGNEVSSHGWLTFGGVICDGKMTSSLMLEVFDALIDSFRKQDVQTFIYKAIPHIYHQQPAEEDLYALFRNNAQLFRRDVSSAIYLKNTQKFTKGKRWSIKKAEKINGLCIEEPEDFGTYWNLLTTLINKKYEQNPVHSLDEIRLLKQRFPSQIKLYTININNQLIGGTLIFKNEQTIHTQYIASNDQCREVGGLDALFSFLITEQYKNQEIFDFGISNEQNGWFLNEGLSAFKEGFGARAIVHDFYRLNINQ